MGGFAIVLAMLAQAGAPGTAEATSEGQACIGPLTYRSATVYAAATDYYFANAAGSEVRIRLGNLDTDASGFGPLTALDESAEGPPSENPAMVGREFNICFDGLDIRAEATAD